MFFVCCRGLFVFAGGGSAGVLFVCVARLMELLVYVAVWDAWGCLCFDGAEVMEMTLFLLLKFIGF